MIANQFIIYTTYTPK